MVGSEGFVNQKNYVAGSPKPEGAFRGQLLLYTNGSIDQWSGTQWVNISTNGAKYTEPSQLANEENPATYNAFGSALPICDGVVITGTAAVSVNDGVAALLFGLTNNSAAGVTATITGFKNNTGAAATVVFTLAAQEVVKIEGEKLAAGWTVTASVTNVLKISTRAQ